MLNFHLITSRTFWVGAPMIITEIIKRGHYLSIFDEEHLPPLKTLLECDVFMDMSTITKKSFYHALAREYKSRKSKGPVMIDPPEAIVNSFDKRLTHNMFSNLVPESYVLTGKNNKEKIEKFKGNEFLVIKSLQGWWGEGVERLSPQNALKKHSKSKDLIVQKYVPPSNGVGRIVTLSHKGYFEIVVAYTRFSRSWRTGTDVSYTCKKEPVTKKTTRIATGMIFVSETADKIFEFARKYNKHLIVFMETGSNFGPQLLKYGADTVLSEFFPFYDFYGDTKYLVSKKDK